MSVLIATAKAADANSYATVALADLILGKRLYTTKWDSAATTPDAEGYQVNSTGGYTAGVGTVAVDTGTGTFTAGSKFSFAGHATVYTVSTALSSAGNLTFTPVLTASVADDEVVSRITASEKEKALIWATTIFDAMMVWYGTKRTTAQALRWPRSGVYNADNESYDYDTIPSLLEVATAEYGLVLLTTNKFKLPAALGLGVSDVKAGPLSAKIDPAMGVQEAIPQNILSLLSPLGHLETEASVGSSVIPMKRA